MSQQFDLEIRLLGGFEFRIGSLDIAKLLSPCDQRLLAFLSWKCGERIGRERIIDQLWPDLPPARALRALNTSLWRIRKVMRDLGYKADDFLCTSGVDVALLRAPLTACDILIVVEWALRIMEREISQADCAMLCEIERIVETHQGAFLPDMYDDWCLVPRETLRNHVAALQEFLVLALMHQKKWRDAVLFAQRLVSDDPLQENAHQWIIRCYLMLGDRARAKRQYDQCEAILREELGVKPLPGTSDLLQVAAIPHRPGADMRAAKLQGAIDSLDAARASLIRLGAEMS